MDSSLILYPAMLTDVTDAYPYLRAVENSSTGILNNPYWRQLKNVLIDKNYYDKTPFAIPYSQDTPYNLKGYLGVSDCNLDVFVNGIYSFTTSTGSHGEFEINFTFPKGTTELSFQARDKFNIKFSRKSAPYSFRTLNAYTWFSVIGEQYAKVQEELNYAPTDINIQTCRYSVFEERFSNFIELYKFGTEDATLFRNIAFEVFKAFEFTGYDEALIMILNAFQANVANFDHYEIFYNNSLYQTIKTGKHYVCQYPTLTKHNYYYGVTTAKLTGEETTPTILRVDRRWWPGTSTGYVGYNVLTWEPSANAEIYYVYRGITSTGMIRIAAIPGTVYVDGGFTTSTITPPEYNFTDLEPPLNLKTYNDTRITNYLANTKKSGHMDIILYATSTGSISDNNIARIRLLLTKMIPPELVYNVIHCNDTTITLYTHDIDS